MRGGILAALILSLAATAADAALLGRAPLTSGGTDYQAYYDTVLNITWLADANLAATNQFGVAGITPGWGMVTTTAKGREWIAAMNLSNGGSGYLGVSAWRLPRWVDTGPSGVNCSYSGTDCGWEVDVASGEIAHLWYSTLDNFSGYEPDGTYLGCQPGPYYCMRYRGPFSNLQIEWQYAYGNAYLNNPNSTISYAFQLHSGMQGLKSGEPLALWAVTDGDPFAPVPVPAAVWLFGGALLSLGALKRRQSAAKD